MKIQTQHPTANAAALQVVPVRNARREREFGTGYGRSSGYASSRRYISDYGLTRFRFG